VHFHGDPPEQSGKSENGQEIDVEGQEAAVPEGIAGNVGKVGQGGDETDRFGRGRQLAQRNKDAAVGTILTLLCGVRHG